MADDKQGSQRNSKPINVAIEPEEPKDMDLSITQIQNMSEYGRRSHDKWLMNERSGSSAMFRNNGQSNIAAGKYAQYKLNPNGSTHEATLVSETVTNRKILDVDEFVFNNHKLNTQLIDFADFRKVKVDQNQNCVVGNFTMLGSVLTKAWEENLKRYTLIRRPSRMSLFSPLLNVPDIMPASQVQSPLKSSEKLTGISDKGYQVNMIIYDHKTRIGNEGEDRKGIDRSVEASGGIIKYSGGGGGGKFSPSKDGTTCAVGSGKGVGGEHIPVDDWTKDMAIRCSNQCGIPADWLWAQWKLESSFDHSDGNFNFGGVTASGSMEANSHGFAVFHSAEEWADYFAKYILLYDGVTAAKTLEDYVTAVQAGGYCMSPPGRAYVDAVLSILNDTTVLK